jgi:DNA-binding IclR family transcriptional regulator
MTPAFDQRPATGGRHARSRTRRDGNERSPESRQVRSLLNALDVLDVIGRSDSELGVSEIARRSGMSKGATYAILRTLETRRIVARDSERHAYRLGWGLYELGSQVVRNLDLARAARTHLDELARHTRVSVLLGIVESDSILYVDRGESPDHFRIFANIGRRSPIHASASGRAILAFSSADLVQRVLAGPLESYTPSTVTNPRKLQQQLELTRKRGYATCWQEVEIGLCSIGVPLRDYSGDVVAALTLAGPMTRVNYQSEASLVGQLLETAQRIEERLGAPPTDRPTPGLDSDAVAR